MNEPLATASTAPASRAASPDGRAATRKWLLVMAAGISAAIVGLALGGAETAAALPAPDYCPDCWTPAHCEDLKDNDRDGRVDYPADPGCSSYDDNDEADVVAPPPPPPPGPGYPQCSDGADNDGDGLVDAYDFTGCTSSFDDNEGDDVYALVDPTSPGFGYGEIEAAMIDGGTALDPNGQLAKCSYVGTKRRHKAPIGTVWTMNMMLRFCWNGSVVTRIDQWQVWEENNLDWFPANLVYSVKWRTGARYAGSVGVAQTSVFAQDEVEVCVVRIPKCIGWRPWIRFYLHGNGAAHCETDAERVVGCRGVRP